MRLLLPYLIQIGDDAMILGQRLSEWCSKGPSLEQDIALSNIALDIIGQARTLYSFAAELQGFGSEDSIAFGRDAGAYRNLQLLEMPNTDFAYTIAKLFYYSQYFLIYLAKLENSENERLAMYARKTIKEVQYHVRYASEWVIRLGDGTEISHLRMQKAIDELWPYTGEMFMLSETEPELIAAGTIPDQRAMEQIWLENTGEVIREATLTQPSTPYMFSGGRKGVHTEHLGYILAEMQYLQRVYPNLEW